LLPIKSPGLKSKVIRIRLVSTDETKRIGASLSRTRVRHRERPRIYRRLGGCREFACPKSMSMHVGTTSETSVTKSGPKHLYTSACRFQNPLCEPAEPHLDCPGAHERIFYNNLSPPDLLLQTRRAPPGLSRCP